MRIHGAHLLALLAVVVACGTPSTKVGQPDISRPDATRGQPHQLPAAPGADTLITRDLGEIVAFSPNADALWPGSIVRRERLHEGVLTPVTLPRAPGTLTLTGHDIAGEPFERVESPGLDSVAHAKSRLLERSVPGTTPAQVSVQYATLHSVEQAALEVGVSASWLGSSVRGQFDKAGESRQTTLMVRFVQKYYDLSFAPPSGASGVVEASATKAGLPEDGGRSLGYVSTVSYGRMALLTITSSRSAEEIRSAFELAAGFGGARLSVGTKERMTKLLESSEIRALILGGNAGDAVVIRDLKTLKKYVENGAQYSAASPGVPIAYQVRNLADNTAELLAYAHEYRRRPARETPVVLELRWQHIDVFNDGSGGRDTWTLKAKVGKTERTLWDRKRDIGDNENEQHGYRGPDGDGNYNRYSLALPDDRHVFRLEAGLTDSVSVQIWGLAHDDGDRVEISEVVLRPDDGWGCYAEASHRMGAGNQETEYFAYFSVREVF